MAAPVITIKYTDDASVAYEFIIDNFGDNAYPRSYMGSVSFDLSANGASMLGGPAYKQKYQWVVSTIMQTADAEGFDVMFQAWDTDRGKGLSAACKVVDKTWGSTVNTSAVFVTAPSYTRLGPRLTLVSFGLQEV